MGDGGRKIKGSKPVTSTWGSVCPPPKSWEYRSMFVRILIMTNKYKALGSNRSIASKLINKILQ